MLAMRLALNLGALVSALACSSVRPASVIEPETGPKTASVSAGSGCTPPSRASLDIVLVAQRSENSCWAAVTQMIASSFGINTDQCARRRGQPLALAELQHELGCRRRPVAFSWNTGNGTRHIMVAYGYHDDQIEIADPWAPCTGMKRTIAYDVYAHGPTPGSSSHADDFYGFHLRESPLNSR